MNRFFLGLLIVMTLPTLTRAADPPPKPIRVLVWDEQQPAQKKGYGDQFLGQVLAAHLTTNPALQIKSAALADPDQGITPEVLDRTDVLIWWGHIKHRQVKWETG